MYKITPMPMKSDNRYRYKIRKWLFDRIFPRGRQYVKNQAFPEGYMVYKSPERALRIITRNPDRAAKGIVICAHPYLSDACGFFINNGHADLYKKLNIQLILFDFNGFGESPFSDFNFDLDIADIYRWTRERNRDLPIFLHGISFGASQIIRFLKNHNNSFVDSAIIENCLDKSIHYFKLRNKKIFFFLRLLGMIRPTVRKEGDYTEIIRHVRNIGRMAFIFGKNDLLTTTRMGNMLQKNCPVPSDVLLYEGKHLKAIEEKHEYQPFLEKFLNP